jgi:cobalt-zinc-cadmium efflux system outer membrane protein
LRLFISAILLGIVFSASAAAQADENVTRAEAVRRALGDDPGVAAAREGANAAEASVRQAGARPNPTLDLQLEDFGGTDAFSGTGGAQATYTLEQEFSLGGDRRARRRAAEGNAAAAFIRAGLTRADLQEAIETAFVEAQAAEALARIATTRVATARDLSAAVARRVAAARDPAAAGSRVAAQLAEAEAAQASAIARAAAAKAALASYWSGLSTFSIDPLSFETAVLRVGAEAKSADIALAEAERARAAAEVDVEIAKQAPDPSVTAGFRQLRETDSSAFVVGVSVPLPIWNRNSGAVAAARAEASRAGYEVKARERALARETAYLASQAAASRAEIAAYATRIIPGTERAQRETVSAYAQGGLSYIEVLDAEAALTQARERQVAALLMFHKSEIRLARLNGAMSAKIVVESSE